MVLWVIMFYINFPECFYRGIPFLREDGARINSHSLFSRSEQGWFSGQYLEDVMLGCNDVVSEWNT